MVAWAVYKCEHSAAHNPHAVHRMTPWAMFVEHCTTTPWAMCAGAHDVAQDRTMLESSADVVNVVGL